MPQTPAACIQVFAKAPVPGRVKTRLAATLGDARAAQIAVVLFNEMLRRCNNVATTQCWVGGEPLAHPDLGLCEALSVLRFAQQGQTLGEKMCHAMNTGLRTASRVVIVGSDCLGVTESVLEAALDALLHHDQVFVPAQDGGFVLWGARSAPDVNQFKNQFKNVAWGTPDVWAQTTARLDAAKVDYHVLPAAWDVDEVSDLKRLPAGLIDV